MGIKTFLYNKILAYLNKEIQISKSYLCDFDRALHEIRPADIILVTGHTRLSRIIKNISQSPWTHAALYIGRLHDIDDARLREFIQYHYQGSPKDQLIIESYAGTGTSVADITKYRNDHIRICRPSGLDYQDAQKVIEYASRHIGNEYDIRHLFDLARFYLGSIFIPSKWQSVLFNYKPNQTSRDVCSVLIADAFASIKFPILPLIREDASHQIEIIRRNPWLCAPCDFDYSPYFDIIKYPMLPNKMWAHYRNFPWREDLISNDDVGVKNTEDDDTKSE